MGRKNVASSDRAARVAAMQAEQARKDRRWRIGIAAAAALPVVALVVALVLPLAMGMRSNETPVASGPIEGVQTFSGLTANHVSTAVQYAQQPPVGGDHTGYWQNCGIYDEPIDPIEPAVHSLEHGAVWITYDPSLSSDEVGTLRALARNKPYAMLSPMEGLPAPIVASAWGLQITAESASDERLPSFLATYMQGPQTPERGASCFGGVGTPSR